MKIKIKKINKLTNTMVLILIFSIFPLFVSNKDKIYILLNDHININNISNENAYLEAKVDTLYPVTTIRKVTSDKDAVNLLFLGDNYSSNDPEDDFSNFVYSNIVLPWFSTVYPQNKEELNSQTEITRGTRIPFQNFVNDKINVYSVQPIGKHVSSMVNNKETFFGINNSANTPNSMVGFGNWGIVKNKVLLNDVTNNFLESGAIISDRNTNTVFNGYDQGRTPCWFWTMPSTCKWVLPSVHIHEMMHSLFKLCDEYDPNMTLGVNRTYLKDINNLENIPWKEFLNFRGVGLVSTSPVYNQYIPSGTCLMKDTYNPKIDFCEVCIHQINTKVAEFTQQELFYIADPQLTTFENRPTYSDNLYSESYLESLEVYDFCIPNASNSHLDFRTVVDNKTSKPRNIKLRVNVSGDGGFEEFSDTFHIEPGEIKQLKLITSNQTGILTKNNNKIIGQVIDADTNEVLATNYDRLNYLYLSSENWIEQNINYGKKLYTVTINFLDKKTNQPLPNIKPSVLIKRDESQFVLEKILFNGYQLDTIKSNINTQYKINKQNLTFNYYYDALPSKSLKLKLVDENNQLIQEKNVSIYEGQEFIPKSSDFFLYDLENYYGDNNNQNQNWIYSVQPPNHKLSYYEINDNQTELVYKIIQSPSTYLNIANRRIFQNKNTSLYLSLNCDDYFNNVYNYKYELDAIQPSIIYNNIDMSEPGIYNVTFFHNTDPRSWENKILKTIEVEVVPNLDKDMIPSSLEAELNRLSSYDFLYMSTFENRDALMNDFEFINQNNLLDNISNLALNKHKFDYEVIDFRKLYPGIDNEVFLGYHFKIKINDKISKSSMTTNYFTKYIWLNEDAPITPPTEEVEMQNEIDRINKLSLSLKNSILTQEEVNNINQNNILENVNGWIETSGFAYEVTNFNNSNNQFKLNIKVSKNNLTQNSKEFTLSYQIKSEQTEQELLQQEINRINNLTLSFANNTFSQQEIDQINTSNFINYLSNWNLVTLNSNKYSYEIINLNRIDNKFTFNVKVSLISDSSIALTSNQFNLNYQITTNVNQTLLNEKNRIDQLDLTFNKQEFSQDEINGILNNPSSIINYLNNWEPDSQNFNYQFIVNPLSNNRLGLIIQINDKNNPNEYQSSKSFVLYYEQLDIPNNNNNNNGSSNNLTTIILASTLAPVGAIVIGASGTIIYKKKRRRY